MASFDSVIVGSGLSGLAAADFLQRSGQKVAVLEARDRVGGRLFLRTTDHGAIADLGGAYVGPTQDRVLNLARELGLELYDVPYRGSSVLNLNGDRRVYEGTIPRLPILHLIDLNDRLREITKVCQEIPMESPWSAQDAAKWDSLSVQEWVERTTWTDGARAMVRAAVQAFLCCEPHEVSMLFFLFYCHEAGGVMRLVDTKGGAQEKKFLRGSAQLCEGLARRLRQRDPECIRLNSVVSHISHDDSGVEVTCENGTRVRARRVVLALAPALMQRFRVTPPLPAERVHLQQRMFMGFVMKTVTYYRTAFWRDAGFSGVILDNTGPITYSYDDTKPDNHHPAIVGFSVTRHAQQWRGQTVAERRRAICEQYARSFNNEAALDAIDYVELDWSAEEFSSGCVGIAPPGMLTTVGNALRAPVGRIHFAGTETARQWAGYMDGAIEAAERAAREVLHAEGVTDCGEDAPMPPPNYVPPVPAPDRYIPGVGTLLRVGLCILLTVISLAAWRWLP